MINELKEFFGCNSILCFISELDSKRKSFLDVFDPNCHNLVYIKKKPTHINPTKVKCPYRNKIAIITKNNHTLSTKLNSSFKKYNFL